MLRVTIELVPHGDETRKSTIGQVLIANDGSGSLENGNYKVVLTKEPPIAKKTGKWKTGEVKDFPRLKLGPYDILYRALVACGISKRNSQ